jgi:hypothetical protein
MKKYLKIIGVILGIIVIGVAAIALLTPWMNRWGATNAEIAASLPGDELVPSPVLLYNRAVTVKAAPEQIYPWLVQMGAERGGLYSYSWFETHVLQCKLVNADRIHPEWQDLKAGDKVKMCPGDLGPVPFDVASVEPNRAVVLGHSDKGTWLDTWQFVLIPHTDGTTRLILRSRDMKSGGLWTVMRPGQFVMERGMLLGIKQRAERAAQSGSIPLLTEMTPTPEAFIPLDKAIPDYGIILEGVHLDPRNARLSKSFPLGCTGGAPVCTQARAGYKMLSVTFSPRDLPQGQILAYKNLPLVRVVMEDKTSVAYSIYKYDNAAHTLSLGFEVPESAAVFGLKWADLTEIPLKIVH